MTRPCLLLSLSFAVLACSDAAPMDVDASVDAALDATPLGRAVAADGFCAELSEMICAMNDTCCGGAVAGEEGETCVAQQLAACSGTVGVLVTDPRTAYVPERGGAFLDAWAARGAACFAEPPRLSEFEVLFAGTGIEGADCTPPSVSADGELRVSQLSCADGLACHLYRRSDGSPMGVCEPREDEACSHRFDCEASEWCNLPSGWEPGRWGACQPLKAEGWTCTRDLECASSYCDATRTCSRPLAARYCATRSYADAVLAASPRGYWRLDDAGGAAAVDASGRGLDGSYVGSPSAAMGATDDGGGMRLDGVDDGVLLPAMDGELGDTLSIECWFRRGADSTTGPLVEFREGEGERGVHVWNHNAPDKAYVNFIDEEGTSHTITSAEGTIEADTWHHVVATYDGSAGRLYVDGESVGDVLMETIHPMVRGNVRIGLREGDERHITGAVDEVAIYDRALSRTEVREHGARARDGAAPQDFVLFRWLR